MDRATLAACIDHTLLRPEATGEEIDALCAEAVELGVAAVCVSPARLPVRLVSGAIAVAAVVGFPNGAHRPDTKAHEAAGAVDAGAREIDMVVDLGLVRSGRWPEVRADVAGVRRATPGAVLKVIVESAALTDHELAAVCEAAVAAGADLVKTSTGFHPAGGATVEAVARIAQLVGPGIGVKASGGIRDTATALAMVDAGATRLGCSATRAILEGLPDPPP